MTKKRECSTHPVKTAEANPLDDIDGAEGVPAKIYSTEELAAMKQRGLSLSEIGRLVGCSKQAIGQRLAKHMVAFDRVERFRKDKSTVLHDKQRIILESITEADVAKMKNVRDKAVSFGILYDKCRLEEGLSTGNISSWTTVVAASQKLLEKDITPAQEVIHE